MLSCLRRLQLLPYAHYGFSKTSLLQLYNYLCDVFQQLFCEVYRMIDLTARTHYCKYQRRAMKTIWHVI